MLQVLSQDNLVFPQKHRMDDDLLSIYRKSESNQVARDYVVRGRAGLSPLKPTSSFLDHAASPRP